MATSRRLALALFLLSAVAACSQSSGEPCQVNRDCDDGLICVIARGSERGTCERPSDVEETLPDAGEEPDPGRDDIVLDEPDAGLAMDASADDDAG